MKAHKQWLLANPVIGDKTSKRPLDIFGNFADWSDSSCWITFEDAQKAISNGVATHCGFIFTEDDPFLVLDLDNKENKPDVAVYINSIADNAAKAGHYVETSFSGLGYHIIFKGRKNSTRCRRKDDPVEYYSDERFIIITGNSNGNEIKEDASLTSWADNLLGDIPIVAVITLTELPQEHDDATIIDRLFSAKNGADNRLLYCEYVDGDDSVLDQSLIERICFYTKSNEQARRLFKESFRGQRDKVIKRGNEYIDRSIQISRSMAASEIHPMLDMTPPTDPVATAEHIEAQPPDIQLMPPNQYISDGEIPFPPGLLGELANYLYINAIHPVKKFAIANALTMMAGIVGRKYSFRGSTINLYQLIIGRSGSGKDAGRKPIAEIRRQLAGTLFADFMGPESASGQAMFATLESKPCYSVYTGELCEDLIMMSSQKAGANERTMLTAYLRLYDEDFFAGKVHRDSKNDIKPVERPAISIMGSGTPDFFENISDYAIKRGLIPRFIIMEHEGNTPPFNDFKFSPPHPKIISGITNAVNYALYDESKVIDIEYENDAVEKQSIAYRNQFVVAMDASHTVIEQGLYNRVHLNLCRVASVVAATEDPGNPVITMPILEWAYIYLKNSLDGMLNKYRTGELGSSTPLKQEVTIRRLFVDWYNMSERKRRSYSKELAEMPLHMPRRYIDARCKMLACFSQDARGYKNALNDALYNLEITEQIFTMSDLQKQQQSLTTKLIYCRKSN